MSYNYDEILSQHLTSFKSRSRSRSRSRSPSRRRTKDRKRERRHRERPHHHDHKRHKSSKHRNSNRDRDRLSAAIHKNEEEEELQFAKKVEEELKAKEQHLVESQLAIKKKSSKRKERLKRLQKLRSTKKEKEISRKAEAETEKAEKAEKAENGYSHNNKSPPNKINNNTENIQMQCKDKQQEYDIFAQNDDIILNEAEACATEDIMMNQNPHLTHNWDDSDGYYVVVVGDIIDGKYRVMGTSGKGVYSSVLRVRDIKNENNEYVIKVIRNNEHMKKQGLREIKFLREMRLRDTLSKHHCIILYDSFWFRNHLCLLFEGMKCDLRRLLRSINISHSGLSIKAVYEYTKQLFHALQLLSELNIIHADIKPDNILVSADYRTVKLCDFGSSFRIDEVEQTPTVGSRYYRAPEIMIGINWSKPCDVWSLACTLFEIYSTHFLFKGANNNEMLLNILALCGSPPLNTKNTSTNYKNGMFYKQHFNENGDFLESKYDSVAQFDILIPHKLVNKSRFCANNMSHILLNKLSNIRNPNVVNVHLNYHERCKLNQFADLLAKMLNLNVNKRITPKQALKHPFCANPMK